MIPRLAEPGRALQVLKRIHAQLVKPAAKSLACIVLRPFLPK